MKKNINKQRKHQKKKKKADKEENNKLIPNRTEANPNGR